MKKIVKISDVANKVMEAINWYLYHRVRNGVWAVEVSDLFNIISASVEKAVNLAPKKKIVVVVQKYRGINDVFLIVRGLFEEPRFICIGEIATSLWLRGNDKVMKQVIKEMISLTEIDAEKVVLDNYGKFKKTPIYKAWIQSGQK